MGLLRRHGPGQARTPHRPTPTRAGPQPPTPAPRVPAWHADDTPERAEDVITLGGIFGRDYTGSCRTAIKRLTPAWQAKTGSRPARARNAAIGGALCAAIVVILAMLGTLRPSGPAGTGTARCAARSAPHPASAPDYQWIRAQFAGAQRPDLRLAGTPHIDLIAAPRTARGTDRYEAAGFYQRRARACARHTSKIPSYGPAGRSRPRAQASRPACLTWRPAGGARLGGETCGYARAAPG